MTDPDASVRSRTIEVMLRLTALCAELGGGVLVHGSPKQRQIAPGETPATASARLRDGLAQAAALQAKPASSIASSRCPGGKPRS